MTWGMVVAIGIAGGCAGALGRTALAGLRRAIVVRRGVCEAVCALMCTLTALRWAGGGLPGWWLPIPLMVAVFGVPLCAADLVARRLPSALTGTLFVLTVLVLGVVALSAGPAVLGGAAAGSAVFGGVHAAVHRLSPASLGGGDVKLAPSLGAVLGALDWAALAVAACLAGVITCLLAACAVLTRRTEWRSGTPHGPGMLLATWLLVVLPGAGLA